MSKEKLGGNARSDVTRLALITAATGVFAKFGYEAVSTRVIAAEANVHPALIGYHFGSKEGLYLAVFETIASAMEQRVGPALANIDAFLNSMESSVESRQRCIHLLGSLCETMLATLADESSGPWGPLMMREQQAPSQAFDLIYERFMQRMMGTMTRLVLTIDPSRSEAAAKLTVVSLMGQTMVFRVAREGVLRHMGWDKMGPDQVVEAQAAIRENLRRMC
jgi:TetR/AcrR family transcriptional regulator, regulator of cefoperazone and chloramphenicol sensitivity